MPTYVVTAPDGREYEIDAPEGATQEQVLAYAQQNYQQAAQPKAAPAPVEQYDPTEGMGFGEKMLAGIGKSVYDTGRGVGQLFGMVDQEDVDAARQRDAALMRTGGGVIGNVVGQVGQMAVPLGGGARIASALGKTAPYAAAAVRGGAFAATQPVATGETRAGNTARGAALSVAGQGVANAAMRLGKGAADKLSPAVLAAYQRAQQAGIPVHFSQLTGSKAAKTLASAISYLPFSGSGKAAAAQQEAFNRAVGRSFGADAGALTDDVMGAARKRLGDSFEDIYSRNAVTLDDAALAKLAQIEQAASRNLPPNEAQIVKNQIDDLMGMTQNGAMPGLAYQGFRTDRLLPMEGGQRSFLTNSIRDIRKTLDDAANRSVGPADARALGITRREYRNMKTTEKSLSQVAGSQGNVKPASLWPIVNGAKGSTSEMRELAKIGQLIKDQIPDSGTAGRLMAYTGLGGGAAAAGGAAALSPLVKLLVAGATAGRALNSQAASRYLAQGSAPLRGLARMVQPANKALPAGASALVAGDGLELDVGGGRVATPEELAAEAAFWANDPRMR